MVRCFAGATMTDDTVLATEFLAIGRDSVYGILFGLAPQKLSFGATEADECVTFYNPFRDSTRMLFALIKYHNNGHQHHYHHRNTGAFAATRMRYFMCINYLLFLSLIFFLLLSLLFLFFFRRCAFGRFIQSITLTCGGALPLRLSPSTFIMIIISEQPSDPLSSFRSFVFHLWSGPVNM